MKGLLLGAGALAAAAGGGWMALVKAQGDSHMVFEGGQLSDASGDGRAIHGEVTIVNRGKAGGVVHKVEGRLVSGGTGQVLVTRQGSRPPQRGWWQSLCLWPGDSCVAEIEVELQEPPTGPVTIELDAHEVGRRLKVHRLVRLTAAAPVVPVAATSA